MTRQAVHLARETAARALMALLALTLTACEPPAKVATPSAGGPQAESPIVRARIFAARSIAPTLAEAAVASAGPADAAPTASSSGWPEACAAYLRIVGYCADRLEASNPARASRLHADLEKLSGDWINAPAQNRDITVHGMECSTALILFTRVEAPVRGCGGDDLPLPPPPITSYPITCQNYFKRAEACISNNRGKNAAFELENVLGNQRETINSFLRSGDTARMNGSCMFWAEDFKDDMHDRGLDC